MKLKVVSIILAFFGLITMYGCESGPTEGGETTEVWEGNYTGSASGSGTNPQGPLCLEITRSGGQVSGNAWISGYLWEVSLSGNVTGNTISGKASGKDLTGKTITVNFTLNVSVNTMSGTIQVDDGINSWSFDVNLEKKTTKTKCGWASRELALAFATALGNASGDNALGSALASFITRVPTVEVEIDGKIQDQDWWACIWEVRDNVNSTEFTLGAIIELSPPFQRKAGWYVQTGTPGSIGVDTSLNSQEVNASLGTSGNQAAYLGGTFSFAADGTNDNYYNGGTQVGNSPQLIFVSQCSGGVQYKVYMTTISSFYIRFNGLGTDSINHTFESPSDASSLNQNQNVEALYIQIDNC